MLTFQFTLDCCQNEKKTHLRAFHYCYLAGVFIVIQNLVVEILSTCLSRMCLKDNTHNPQLNVCSNTGTLSGALYTPTAILAAMGTLTDPADRFSGRNKKCLSLNFFQSPALVLMSSSEPAVAFWCEAGRRWQRRSWSPPPPSWSGTPSSHGAAGTRDLKVVLNIIGGAECAVISQQRWNLPSRPSA